MLHPKILALKLRSRPTVWANMEEVLDNEVLQLELRGHMDSIRAKRKLDDNQKLICFCVWGVKDTHGTAWVRGTFIKSIKDRGPESKANQKIAFCWQHDLCDPIGKPVEIFEDERGAFAVITFSDPEAVPNAKRALSQIEDGTLNGYSFGFEPMYDKMEYEEATDTIWIREVVLFEISVVTFASVRETHTVRSIQDFETRKMKLDDQTKDFIKGLPAGKQLELRQILDEHITLAKFEPEEKPPLNPPKPDAGFELFGVSMNNL